MRKSIFINAIFLEWDGLIKQWGGRWFTLKKGWPGWPFGGFGSLWNGASTLMTISSSNSGNDQRQTWIHIKSSFQNLLLPLFLTWQTYFDLFVVGIWKSIPQVFDVEWMHGGVTDTALFGQATCCGDCHANSSCRKTADIERRDQIDIR